MIGKEKLLKIVQFGKFPFDKNYQIKINRGRQQAKSFIAGHELFNKIYCDNCGRKTNLVDIYYIQIENKGYKVCKRCYDLCSKFKQEHNV